MSFLKWLFAKPESKVIVERVFKAGWYDMSECYLLATYSECLFFKLSKDFVYTNHPLRNHIWGTAICLSSGGSKKFITHPESFIYSDDLLQKGSFIKDSILISKLEKNLSCEIKRENDARTESKNKKMKEIEEAKQRFLNIDPCKPEIK